MSKFFYMLGVTRLQDWLDLRLRLFKKRRSFQYILHIFTLKNLYWCLYGYFGMIIVLICLDFKFPDRFWQDLIARKLPVHRVMVYSSSNRIGERTLSLRVNKVLQDFNVCTVMINVNDEDTKFAFVRHLYTQAANVIYFLIKPKFHLALTHYVNIMPCGYKIVYLNVSNDDLYISNNSFIKQWQYLNKYDAYIDLYSFVHGDNHLLRQVMQAEGVKKPIIPLYLAQNHVSYRTQNNFKRALITGSLWGCGRNSLRMRLALQALAQQKLLIAYGLPDHLGFLQEAYKGYLHRKNKNDGLGYMEQVFNQEGIALITHNLEHMLEGIPTLRIAESIMQSMLVISDEHVFIKKHFGASVLYFNSLASTEEIYQQIKAHIIWAQNNPKQAQQKILQAHKILSEKFTLEQQLKKLLTMKFA